MVLSCIFIFGSVITSILAVPCTAALDEKAKKYSSWTGGAMAFLAGNNMPVRPLYTLQVMGLKKEHGPKIKTRGANCIHVTNYLTLLRHNSLPASSEGHDGDRVDRGGGRRVVCRVGYGLHHRHGGPHQ